MISPNRTTIAHQQGAEACRRTKGRHSLTVCPYHKWTAQNRQFSAGWNQVWQLSRKFWMKAHEAMKEA